MSIIDKKYGILSPQKQYVTDTVILAQAWKKSHNYIRRHNWYANVLELDLSTLDLENRLNEWSQSLESEEYRPAKLRLVPAPKTCTWEFTSNGWHPVKEKLESDKTYLRPLAHIKIQDQTIASAIMLCSANAIETLQGPTDIPDYHEAQRKQVFNYGNRLYCHWDKNEDGESIATFPWGNSKCYRMYYDDYQKFLERPKHFCQLYTHLNRRGTKHYVFSLDLKSFYDSIDRAALIDEAEELYNEYVERFTLDDSLQADPDFWEMARTVFDWEWNDSDQAMAKQVLNKDTLPDGIPQGLVAGGFFSNIYLLRFDQEVGKSIHQKVASSDFSEPFIIRDYCRYVDDIRLVVEAADTVEIEQLKQMVTEHIQAKLNSHLSQMGAEPDSLEIHPDKVSIQSYEEISNQSDLSGRMQILQGTLSGTPDIEALRQIVGGLDGLIQLSEQLGDSAVEHVNNLALSKIAVKNADVKSDTLKRFAAKRLVDALRLQKSMIGSSDQNPTVNSHIDHDFELYARKLIAVWSKNPSLSSLLKFGLDLFPSAKLLKVVTEALEQKLYMKVNNDTELSHQKLVMEYVSADILCACSVWIGHHSKKHDPEHADLLAFREHLAVFARKILDAQDKMSWYVKQQAALYLASVGQAYVLNDESSELQPYALLHRALLYSAITSKNRKDMLTMALIVQQLHPNPDRFSSWFAEAYQKWKRQPTQKIRSLKFLCANRPDLLQRILSSLTIEKEIVQQVPELSSIIYRNSLKKQADWSSATATNTPVSLASLITSADNPFQQENALLHLMLELLKPGSGKEDAFTRLNSENGLSIEDLQITMTDKEAWQNPYKKPFAISVTSTKSSYSLPTPHWVKAECRWMYNLGCILRACLTGEYDYTTNSFLMRQDHSVSAGYRGLRSTWFSRRFGMSSLASSLFPEPLPLSPWMSELLFLLLQWPGIDYRERFVHGISAAQSDRKKWLKIIQNRMQEQQKVFGKLSNTPGYVLPVKLQKRQDDRLFRVAIVQSLLPYMDDFNAKDPMHWSSDFREKHRAHIADLCHMVEKHLATWHAAIKRSGKESAYVADLIVFPELSVHPDDIDYLLRLSHKTKASIFAGLGFQKRASDQATVNQAIWILNSDENPLVAVWQGKQHMTKLERKMNIQSHRPYQAYVEFQKGNQSIRVAGAICYDATDIALTADLRDISDMFVISALNKDIGTFDNMVSALNYHMFQPVILANTGEYGGSSAQAPFSGHEKIIAQVHGKDQLAISMFDIDPTLFKTKSRSSKPEPQVKSPPAGFAGRK
ncbi:hypothetical protein KM924_00370 [Brevibacillus parabrevis]|uniref:reverse transcriptase domain-containing protein n=1 Tax=Brevibacillus parabrevis TaxID=54914 RepID=UPI001C2237D9|nr:reverse transcriptase domain-containing protein [Brevibacillus parabrevis]MBU8710948.1 hypothetical protein [Brevibacillus parabrevis]